MPPEMYWSLPLQSECFRVCSRDWLIRYHFLAIAGLGEGATAAATWTTAPVTRESAGLRMTLSDGVTPWTISIVVPKSRPTLMSRSSTRVIGFHDSDL